VPTVGNKIHTTLANVLADFFCQHIDGKQVYRNVTVVFIPPIDPFANGTRIFIVTWEPFTGVPEGDDKLPSLCVIPHPTTGVIVAPVVVAYPTTTVTKTPSINPHILSCF
jgi:hypothetical protein